MRYIWIKFVFFVSVIAFVVTGCATAKSRKVAPPPEVHNQISAMQGELVAKDQQIQDLQYQLDQARVPQTNFSSSSSKSSVIRVKGVTVADVQSALKSAGFDPGPIDGRIGKKTKSAIKAFQRAHGLSADGVVGANTWAALRS